MANVTFPKITKDTASITVIANGDNIITLPSLYAYTSITASYTASNTDNIIGVISSGSSISITLPAAHLYSSINHLVIKDESGSANSNNITIKTVTNDFLDGATSYTMSVKYQSIGIYTNSISAYYII